MMKFVLVVGSCTSPLNHECYFGIMGGRHIPRGERLGAKRSQSVQKEKKRYLQNQEGMSIHKCKRFFVLYQEYQEDVSSNAWVASACMDRQRGPGMAQPMHKNVVSLALAQTREA